MSNITNWDSVFKEAVSEGLITYLDDSKGSKRYQGEVRLVNGAWAKEVGMPATEAARLFGVSRAAIYQWWDDVNKSGTTVEVMNDSDRLKILMSIVENDEKVMSEYRRRLNKSKEDSIRSEYESQMENLRREMERKLSELS